MQIFDQWTLFLDRDGVINRRIRNDYVKQINDFVLLENVPSAIQTFSGIFKRIVVVTNQQGIGKGIMTTEDLGHIHSKMISEIEAVGGRIDEVYFAPALSSERSMLRKPNIGMGLKAKKQFPEINFRQSVMVGDSFSDMQFGKKLGMTTVLVGSDSHLAKEHPKWIDYYFSSLYAFSLFLINHK